MSSSLSRREAVTLALASATLAHLVPWAFGRARRLLRARRRPKGKVLDEGLNPRFEKAVTAVRGKLTLKANTYRQALARGEGKDLPFDRVVECNIGNPQALGQKPVTFVREVLALIDHPELVRDPALAKKTAALFPADAIARAKTLLEKIPGGTGAYSESQGSLHVRNAIAKFIAERDGLASAADVDVEDIFLTDGASEAVKLALQVCLRDSDDCILLPIPQYPLYSGSINLFGGELEGYYLEEDGGEWALNPDEVRRAARAARARGVSPRALVVINPGNPTGNTLSHQNMRDVVRVCAEEKLVLLADEVYQTNLYTTQTKPFVSFRNVALELGFTPETFELFSFHSVSKGFLGECGRRGGYVECFGIAAEAKQAIYRMIALGLCANVAGQATVELMVNPPARGDASHDKHEAERATLLASLERRAGYFCDAFNKMEGVSCNPAEGALYLFPRVRLPDKALAAAAAEGKVADAFYAERLLDATGICIVPGSGFGQREGTWHLRFAFLPDEDAIAGVVGKMEAFHKGFMAEFA